MEVISTTENRLTQHLHLYPLRRLTQHPRRRPCSKGHRLSASSTDDGQDKIVLKQRRKESQAPERSARTSNITISFGTIPVVAAQPGVGRGGWYPGGWG
jgi:hypothetical protein